jgi:hypothetical protein
MVVRCIVNQIKSIFDRSLKGKLIDEKDVENYASASRKSLHSMLQYALIHAGINCGCIAIPEYKVHFKEPLDKKSLGIISKRLMHQMSADVAFIREQEFQGIGEVYTLDEIHGCIPSKELEEPWLTPYEKLHWAIGHSEKEIKFLILVNVCPENLKKERLPWKDQRKRSIKEWKNLWEKLAKELSNRAKVGHVILSEDENIQSKMY